MKRGSRGKVQKSSCHCRRPAARGNRRAGGMWHWWQGGCSSLMQRGQRGGQCARCCPENKLGWLWLPRGGRGGGRWLRPRGAAALLCRQRSLDCRAAGWAGQGSLSLRPGAGCLELAGGTCPAACTHAHHTRASRRKPCPLLAFGSLVHYEAAHGGGAHGCTGGGRSRACAGAVMQLLGGGGHATGRCLAVHRQPPMQRQPAPPPPQAASSQGLTICCGLHYERLGARLPRNHGSARLQHRGAARRQQRLKSLSSQALGMSSAGCARLPRPQAKSGRRPRGRRPPADCCLPAA